MRRQGITRTSHFTPKSVVGKSEALWQIQNAPLIRGPMGRLFSSREKSELHGGFVDAFLLDLRFLFLFFC